MTEFLIIIAIILVVGLGGFIGGGYIVKKYKINAGIKKRGGKNHGKHRHDPPEGTA